MSDDIDIINFNKTILRPTAIPVETGTVAAADKIDQVNDKLDQLIKLMGAIDWKLWLYLKANNYVE